jgi:hypothetical protein
MTERAGQQLRQLDADALVVADPHRPRMHAAVKHADAMRRGQCSREIEDHGEEPRWFRSARSRLVSGPEPLLDHLGERRQAVALEDDRGWGGLERQDRTHRGVVDRAGGPYPLLELLPARRARLEGGRVDLDELPAALCEHDRSLWTCTELREWRERSVIARRREQRGHGLIDRSHASRIRWIERQRVV